jgi:5-methylcytosine-specific restriction endonuclease McrA
MVSETTLYYHRERDKIIEKLGGKCRVCGSRDNLEIHHIKPCKRYWTSGGNSGGTVRLRDWRRNFDKLVLLCKRCHFLWHLKEKGIRVKV